MSNRLTASPAIYQKYDEMVAMREQRRQASMFGIALEKWDEVYPLIAAVNSAPKAATGRSRKRDEDLIVLPRFVVKYLADGAISHVYGQDKEKQKEMEDKKDV